MKTRLQLLALSAAVSLAACNYSPMGRYVDVAPVTPATQPAVEAVKAPAPAAEAPKPAAPAPVVEAPAPKPVVTPAPAPVVNATPVAPATGPAIVIKPKNADTTAVPDPYPSSYTLPNGEVLTAANVQNPLPADGKLSPTSGIHMTLTDLPDKNKLATFQWDEKNVGQTQRRVILTPDTVVDFNGKFGTISDITEAQARGAVVATLAKDGVYAVMLRFGHGLLDASADELSPQQITGLESIAPAPTTQSNRSYEGRAESIASSLNLKDPAQEKAVYQAILTQQESVRDAHNAGFRPGKSVHQEFNKSLSAVLTPDQIDKIKDGLTSDKTPTTFRVYHQIVTDLNSDDDKVIMDFLKQAREESLDIKNVKDMADVYKPYKTKIEAYLNAHGHDYKTLYKTFVDSQKASGNPDPAP